MNKPLLYTSAILYHAKLALYHAIQHIRAVCRRISRLPYFKFVMEMSVFTVSLGTLILWLVVMGR